MTIPKNEKVCIWLNEMGGTPHYLITRKNDDTYTLWDVTVEPMKKVSKGDNPLELEKAMRKKNMKGEE